MLKTLIKKQRVSFAESFSCWQDAIRAAAQPLLRDGAIEECYIDDMIASVNTYGPYIVIAPNIAMPHAQTGRGVNETGISFMKVHTPVCFGEAEEHKAQLIFVLAAIDNQTHLSLMQDLVATISEEKTVDKLLASNCCEDLLSI